MKTRILAKVAGKLPQTLSSTGSSSQLALIVESPAENLHKTRNQLYVTLSALLGAHATTPMIGDCQTPHTAEEAVLEVMKAGQIIYSFKDS